MGVDATRPDVAGFDALEPDDAYARCLGCLGVQRFAEQVVSGRPYATWPALRAAAASAAAELTDPELDAALAGHPRIGEQPGVGHEVEHSRREQSGVDASDEGVAERLVAGNAAYEKRFDRVFLIRAAGRSAQEILGELQRRLSNPDDEERRETVAQLWEIALLRLETACS